MQSFNHVAGGFAFTGIFASFADVNIYDRFDTMAVVWVAAVLPDIDHTRSLSGKAVYPLAKWIQVHYGHRTITHSVFFFAALVALIRGVDLLWGFHYTLPAALALGSHLIFDMCTKQGIPIFYPFSRRPAVLPANPKLRLSANDFRSEAILFVLFCCLNVFCYPLMASGFWSRYNQSFATWDHYEREARRKPADYQLRFLNADSDTISGICVDKKGNNLVVWQHDHFEQFQLDKCRLITFHRLTTTHRITTYNLFQITTDSLNTFMTRPVIQVTVQCEDELFYFEGPIMKKGTTLMARLPHNAHFQKLAQDFHETETKLHLLDLNYQEDLADYNREMAHINTIRQELAYEQNRTTENDFDEGQRRMRVKVLTEKLSQIQEPVAPNAEEYKLQRALYDHKLREIHKINATLLVWEMKDGRRGN